MVLSGAAAGAAGALEDLLKQRFLEQMQRQAQAERIRENDMRNAVAMRGLDQGEQRIGLDRDRLGETRRQFDEQAPTRLANVTHTNASTAALNRQPEEAQKTRDFTAGESQRGRDFQGQQGDLNRASALQIANVRHPDPAGAASVLKQENEIQDALDIIDQIRNDKALGISTGPIQGRGVGALADLEGYTRVKAHHDNLVNKLALAQAGKLKGQGQISNFEREMLQKAATALTRTLGDADYVRELGNVETQFRRMLPGPRVEKAGGAPQQETPDQRLKRLLGGG